MADDPLKQATREGFVELRKKTLHQIQVETAYKWSGRACAAALLGRMDDAEEYAHEAIEHAALSGDDQLLAAEERRAGLDELAYGGAATGYPALGQLREQGVAASRTQNADWLLRYALPDLRAQSQHFDRVNCIAQSLLTRVCDVVIGDGWSLQSRCTNTDAATAAEALWYKWWAAPEVRVSRTRVQSARFSSSSFCTVYCDTLPLPDTRQTLSFSVSTIGTTTGSPIFLRVSDAVRPGVLGSAWGTTSPSPMIPIRKGIAASGRVGM